MPVLVNKMVENFGWVIHGHFDLSGQSSAGPGTETLRQLRVGKWNCNRSKPNKDLTATRDSGLTSAKMV